MKRLNTNQVIEKLRNLYGDTLDYSKVDYKTSRSYITLVCPKHGEFEKYANDALQGRGKCPKCQRGISSTEEFIAIAKAKFGDKFDYSKTDFINKITKVIITCPKHGDFTIQPNTFLNSVYGCGQCRYKDKEIINKPSKEQQLSIKQQVFISRSKEIHNNKYDYSKVIYTKACDKVTIICPIHGEFQQAPGVHIKGHGCPKCAREVTADKTRKTQEEFEKEARAIYGDKYTYGKYTGMHNKMTIVCPIHGSFECTPHNHLVDCGCPRCSDSKGELMVSTWLKTNNILFVQEKSLKIDNLQLYLDFYINLNGIEYIIEYNGIQHYRPVEHFGGEERFKKQTFRDQSLRDYCNEHSIRLLEIPYTDNIEEIHSKLKNFIYG